MASEYDPAFGTAPSGERDDLVAVQSAFADASRAYRSSPLTWIAWGLFLPAAALLTPAVARRFGPSGVLFLWSGAILAGGAVEWSIVLRRRRELGPSQLGSWALTLQGNLSLVAVALSVALVWEDLSWLLPGLWLLLLGHSFFALGGLAFRPLRTMGLIFQLGGALALLPHGEPYLAFAAASAAGAFWMALGVWREQRAQASSRSGAR